MGASQAKDASSEAPDLNEVARAQAERAKNFAALSAAQKAAREALRDAANRGDVATIRALVRGSGEEPPIPVDDPLNDVLVTALFEAAFQNRLPAVRALLEELGASPNMPADANGMTPLIGAASRGHGMVVKALLRGGASVDVRDKSGATALARAAQNGWDPVVRSLLAAGADPLQRTADGRSMLEVATLASTRAIIDLAIFQRQVIVLLYGSARAADSPLCAHFGSSRLYDPAVWRVTSKYLLARWK